MNRTSSRGDYPVYPQVTFNSQQVYPRTTVQPQYVTPGYLQDNTTYLPVSTTVAQPEQFARISAANTTRGSIPLTQYQPYHASESIVYGATPVIHGSNVQTAAVTHGNRQLRTSYMPVVNYVPIVEQVPATIIEPEISRVSQRVIVHEPEIYQRRQTHYQYPKQTLAPTKTVVQQEVNYDPMVETVRGPSWGAESVRASRIRSPPPPAVAKPQKSCFPWWGWLLLGLLGLAGLILGIIFGTKVGQNAVASSPTVAAVAPSTVAVKSNATTTTKTSAESRPASVQPSADLTSATIIGSTATTQPIEAGSSAYQASAVAPATNVVQPITMQPTTIPSTSIKSVEPISSTSTTTTSSSSTVQPSFSGYYTSGSSVTSGTATSTTSGSTNTGNLQPIGSSSVQPIGASTIQPYTYTGSGSVQPVTTAQPITTSPISVQPTTVQPVSSSGATTGSASNTTSSTTRTTTTTTTTTTHALVARHHHQ